MADEKPLISVIIPVYNGERYLASCVESVSRQTYNNLEIIIVNDGSTDGTGQVCGGLQKAYTNIRIITLEDEGVSAARNAGIEASKGQYITFVDADDRLRPNMLQILYDCIQTTECDVAGCSFFIWKSEKEWSSFAEENVKQSAAADIRCYTRDSYIKEAVLQGNSRCWSKLYRKESIGKTRFRTAVSIGEDMLFLIDMLSYVEKVVEIPYQGYGYFQNPGGAIARGFTPKYMDQITCWELAREIIVSRGADAALCVQTTALLMIAVMLTAGKIAMLPYRERKIYENYVDVCHKRIKESLSVTGAYERLSIGYKLKTKLFFWMPHFYLWLYHCKKLGRRI